MLQSDKFAREPEWAPRLRKTIQAGLVTWEDDPKNSFGGPYWITQRKTTL